MAETEKDQKTEDATPKRRKELRDKGKVPRSQDVGAAAALIAAVIAVGITGSTIGMATIKLSWRAFRFVDRARPAQSLSALVESLQSTAVPVLIAISLVTLFVGAFQTGGIFSFGLLAPQWERLNPGPNFKNILPSKQSLIEILKQIVKILIVGFIVYGVIADALPRFTLFASVEPTVAASEVGAVARKLAIHASFAFVAIAAFDYYMAKRKFNEEAKMSKQEIRDEHKRDEGDPQVRRRIRSRMREGVRRRTRGDIKQATVLVVNPTHFSVALRYDIEKDPAPIVLAKGLDEVALQMRSDARRYQIPIIENRPLARTLYAEGKLGKPVPFELYRAVAEVIAHVMRIRARQGVV